MSGPTGDNFDSPAGAPDTRPSDFGPHSGFTPGHTLPPGHLLRDYRIEAVLGEGGFGIVYLAFDMSLERRVAIKEYLPSQMASRAMGAMTVVVKSGNHVETFIAGLKSFVNEARLLARFDHPALVKVHQFWEQNGTAYMVMPYYEGVTLKQSLRNLGHLPNEAELRTWLMPLLDALEVLHAEHCFHRDIAPDNILITAGGPLLLDFGAARRVIGDMTHALTAVLKPGFAPIEQYGEVPGMTQGAWTDIFALASVLYAAASGRKPVPSVERLVEDRMRPLGEVVGDRFSAAFTTTVDQALAIRPKDRPQSVAEFRARMDGVPAGSLPPPMPVRSTVARTIVSSAPRAVAPMPASPPPPMERTVALDIDFAATPTSEPQVPPTPLPRTIVSPNARAAHEAAPPAARQAATELPEAAARRSRAWVGTVAAGLAAVAAVAAWQLRGRSEAPELPAPQAAASATVQPQPAPTPIDLPAPAPAPAPEATVIAPAPAPAPAPQAAPEPMRAASVKPPVHARKPEPKPPVAEGTTPARNAETQARCSDILQKASLEPLSASESAFLRRECR